LIPSTSAAIDALKQEYIVRGLDKRCRVNENPDSIIAGAKGLMSWTVAPLNYDRMRQYR
jgi:hypothetical protein